MNPHLLQKVKIIAIALSAVGALILSGCEGDTGPTGPPGAPASFGSAACDDCHHLNDLPVQGFTEQFVSGLAGPDQVITGPSTTVSFDPTKLPEGETAVSFQWMRVGGLGSTISGATSSTAVVTLPTITSFKEELASNIMGLVVTGPEGEVLSDRAAVVPINPLTLEEATTVEYKLRVTTESGKFFFGLVKVTDEAGQEMVGSIGAVNGGIPNVPVNVPVLLRAATSSGYSWEVTSFPTTTAPVINDADEQFAYFTPVEPGQYVITQTTGTTSEFTIFAGTWRGVIKGVDGNENPIPDTVCTSCHNGTIAPDTFTPWRVSGHAEIFIQNLNAGGHYGPSCFPCHTVGFNTDPAAINNGFDDQTGYAQFIASSFYFSSSANNSRYSRMLTEFPELAQRTNVQCENCHGPQEMGAGEMSSAHTNSFARISLAADVCGVCHGEPLRHSRFQQWQQSPHANFELAVEEGTNNRCAGCHSAQGFLVLVPQLESGNPSRTIPEDSITWTEDTVQPQTCAACHDPHEQGNTSGEPNTATVRVSGNTPKLPAGFAAESVGRGAVCITCHNSRNGVVGDDSFLHEDGVPQFDPLTSYQAPHVSAQSDVLLGFNAYFLGDPPDGYRSPHAIISDTCATCHMEETPPPPLLSYNLSGTNHTFRANLGICVNCHPGNLSFGFLMQSGVQDDLELLAADIVSTIMSRNTGTPIKQAELTESRGSPAIAAVFEDNSTATIALNDLPGVRVEDFGSDTLAKAVWNFLLIENDHSFGIHNPNFTRAVLAATRTALHTIPDEPEDSEL